ncbi:MAG: 4'-phosphopantetheinyl transferase superfamily protein [Caldilineaceae bacterium]
MKEVHIWSIKLEQDAQSGRFAELLSADEAARAARFYFARDAQHYTVGRATLRLILSHYLGMPPTILRFVYNSYGKPGLLANQNPAGLTFNLSHSGGRALCAVTYGHAIGIDLEEMRALDYLAMAATVFSPYEQAVLHNLPVAQQATAFFNGWTRKEAYIKAHGQGLSMPLADFDVTLAPDEPVRLVATRPDPTEAQRWSLYGWSPAEQWVAALAVAGQGWQLTWHNSEELL